MNMTVHRHQWQAVLQGDNGLLCIIIYLQKIRSVDFVTCVELLRKYEKVGSNYVMKSFTTHSSSFRLISVGRQIKEAEMGRACCTQGES
jgi:hypothetical protein